MLFDSLRAWRVSSGKGRAGTGRVRPRAEKARSSVAAAGFTIVEVMIVLGIAGLILLITFEAVPVLERNSRNNQRRQDVSAILQAVSHYELNNSGDFPGPSSNFLQFAQLSYYTTAQIHIFASPAANPMPVTDVNTVNIYNYELCSTTTTGATSSRGADYSNIVALYAVENGASSSASACQQL